MTTAIEKPPQTTAEKRIARAEALRQFRLAIQRQAITK